MADSASVRERWETSFAEQVARHAYNTAPVEALARTVSYYLRDRYEGQDVSGLHFLEMGCGTGPNLVWLARRGARVSGVDISPTALALAHRQLADARCADRVGALVQGSVCDVPFPDASFDGIVEACVFQHLGRDERTRAFGEVRRLLRPGGLFVGYMLDAGHTVFLGRRGEQLADDPGTLVLADGRSSIYLTDLGLCHFYRKDEIERLLSGFATVDPCLLTYELPRDEARRRGYDHYVQSMWTVYAIR